MTEPSYDLTPRPVPELPAALRAAAKAALGYRDAAQAANTRRAYRADWNIFAAWCAKHGLSALPAAPATLQTFLADQIRATLAVSTLRRRLSAIRAAHLAAGHQLSPTDDEDVRRVLAGIARVHNRRPQKKEPLLSDGLLTLVAQVPEGPVGLRDRALLLLGFAGAFRRSELAAVRIEHVTFVKEGMIVHVPRSKTDPQSRGSDKPIIRGRHHCPVAAVQAWLEWLGQAEGPLFRSFLRVRHTGELRPRNRAIDAKEVERRVKHYARQAGFPEHAVAKLAGHSLRAGFVTAAYLNGAEIPKIMDVTGQRSMDTVLGYIRDAKRFRQHAGEGLL